jgi:hypothetical protein
MAGVTVSRLPANIARYAMLKHEHEQANPINR